MIIGVTGGIGSGKSAVVDILKNKYRAYVIKADDVAKKVMTEDDECIKKLKDLFGDSVYNEDGSINKEYVSGVIYKDKEQLKKLDSCVHPIVRKYIEEKMSMTRSRLIVVEAALIIEAGYKDMFDEVWFVYCEYHERIKRIKGSRNLSDERIKEIMDNQLNEDEFKRNCDKLINNSFDLTFTEREIQRVLIWG